MRITSTRELENTREKLRSLEEQYASTRDRARENEQVRELTLISLKRLINQLKEEIVRFESRQIVHRET